jgi:phosphoglucosamine mutase
MARLFGTDGVRGIANEKLTCDLAFKLGQVGAYCLTNAVHQAKILIGRDTRISGDMLESAMIAGICSVGAEAVVAGVIPTAGVAYLTLHYGLDAGVVISASHNTLEYNGIKFFNSSGYKLQDEIEDRIEDIIVNQSEEIYLPTGTRVGRKVRLKKADDEYIDHIIAGTDVSLDGIKVVLDCANGSASAVAPQVFEKLGAQVYPIYNDPDGTNINEYCGSTHPANLSRTVTEIGADVGLAFDGDADRLIAVDSHGNIVDGDAIMAICATSKKKESKLAKNVVVGTVMSNMGLEIGLKENGITLVKTQVGDRYVLEEMLRSGFNFGGEQSGHIIFLEDGNTTGDGIYSGVQLLSVMKKEGRALSRLSKIIEILPQVLVNAKVSEEKKHLYLEDPKIALKIRELEKNFDGEGRVLIRTSGTEPLIRVMIEGKDKDYITEQALGIARLVEERLG